VFAAAAGGTEVIGGLLVAAGLLGPLGPALIVSVMLVAVATVHWQHGVFASNNGVEVPLLYAAAAVALALTGYGAVSFDAALSLTWSPAVIWTVLAFGVVGGFANLAIRKTAPTPAHV
jgi:putative oxidoreductase